MNSIRILLYESESTMIKHNIWFYNYGEISYTAMSPVRVVSEPLPEPRRDTRLQSSDDFRLINVIVGEAREVELPDGLQPELWIKYNLKFHHLWCDHKKANELPINYQIELIHFDEYRRKACVKLLCTNLRSDFRKSLKAQLLNWLDNPNAREYDSPFSFKQWDNLTYYELPSWKRY